MFFNFLLRFYWYDLNGNMQECSIVVYIIITLHVNTKRQRCCHGHDRMVAGFTTTYAISAYHHWSCEFESRSWQGVLDTTLYYNVFSDLWQGRWFSRGTPASSTKKNLPPQYNWNIIESGVKHHNHPERKKS